MEQQNVEQQVTRGLGTAQAETPQPKKAYDFATEVISLPSKGLGYPESHPLSKELSPVPLDLRRTKTAGEALLRPSATDGLIARASKMWALCAADFAIATAIP